MDFDAALSFIRTEIDKQIKGRLPLPKGYLEDFVTQRSFFSRMLDAETAGRLIRHLETIYGTSQGTGNTLKSDYKEWYPERKGEMDFYFWRRLQKYWLDHSILPVQVVDSVDRVTDEVLGYLGDPRDTGNWKRRGLVMGHVQSGKTTNYSALITKAADAGYRIIVVLAGLTNSLRYQTQIRLDQTFVGKSSLADALNKEVYPVANVFRGMESEGVAYQIRHPYCGTTQAKDFSVGTIRGSGASEGNFADPILFVTKKHDKVLISLTEWLQGLRNGEQLEGPMLLIDDEADNASVNTQKDPDKTTKINACIRNLLNCSRRTAYVGYTATPFANIFIDPDTEQEMLKEDLFPSHFIKSLDAPDNYVGAKQLFSDGGEYAKQCVREIPADYQDILPLNHKAGWPVDRLPQSLLDAVCEYIIFRAIRILSGDGARHSSMLVNVSRFNNVQEQVRNHIYLFKEQVMAEVEVWGGTANWSASEKLSRLHFVWDQEYRNCSGYSWKKVLGVLKHAISSIELRMVNMKGSSSLDYSRAPDSGMHIIAVGGLALARGLTLEGLAVSYVLRNVGASDTLLQMGRWFGYRNGYAELCRIHATPEMIEDFREISASVEELRGDLVRMERMGKLPEEFGLKVRQSPTGIAITAANKMRTAKPFLLAADYSCRHLQGYEVFNEDDCNKRNLAAARNFTEKLLSNGADARSPDFNAMVFSGVRCEEVMRFIEAIELPQLDFAKDADGRSLVLNYIQDRKNAELAEWDVAIPFRKRGARSEGAVDFPFLGDSSICCRRRYSGVLHKDGERIVKITEKNVVADLAANDMQYGEDLKKIGTEFSRLKAEDSDWSDERCYAMARTRPLLLIHVVDFKLADSGKDCLNFAKLTPVVTISIVFPRTQVEPVPREYAASKRLIELMKEALSQSESDESIDEIDGDPDGDN